jgi:hypothetical protein
LVRAFVASIPALRLAVSLRAFLEGAFLWCRLFLGSFGLWVLQLYSIPPPHHPPSHLREILWMPMLPRSHLEAPGGGCVSRGRMRTSFPPRGLSLQVTKGSVGAPVRGVRSSPSEFRPLPHASDEGFGAGLVLPIGGVVSAPQPRCSQSYPLLLLL